MKEKQDVEIVSEDTIVEESTAVAVAGSEFSRREVMATVANVEDLTDEEAEALFIRKTEAEAAELAEDDLFGKEIVIVKMTPYSRRVVDKETGEVLDAKYVTFELEDGRKFRTGSSQALPFAYDTALYVGVHPLTGELRRPIRITITPKKSDKGFIYKFVFKGFAAK